MKPPEPRDLASLAITRTNLPLRPRLSVERWGTAVAAADGTLLVSLTLTLSPDDVGLLSWLWARHASVSPDVVLDVDSLRRLSEQG